MLRVAARTMQARLMQRPSILRDAASRLPRMRGESRLRVNQREVGRAGNISAQTKKDQLALALLVARTDPILTAPGGWGLRNPEPEGPGQRTQVFSQCRAAGAWRKSGDIKIPSNDPVTVCRDRIPLLRVLRFAPDSIS